MRLATFQPMLEQATTFSVDPKADTGFKNWHASMSKTKMRHHPEARTAGPIPTFGRMVHDNVAASQSYAPAASSAAISEGKPDIAYEQAQNDDEYTFGDVIDIINPLQHLPVIGTIYRKLTGDTIKPMSNIIGGAIFGGPVGAVSSTINVVAKSTTGRDIAENAMALVGFDVAPQTAKPMIAYEKAASLVPVAHMAKDNLIEIASDQGSFYTMAADGRRNFAARTVFTQSWNA